MPTYKFKDPKTGRGVTLRGDRPPTEQELNNIFAQMPSKPKEQQSAQQAQPTALSFTPQAPPVDPRNIESQQQFKERTEREFVQPPASAYRSFEEGAASAAKKV